MYMKHLTKHLKGVPGGAWRAIAALVVALAAGIALIACGGNGGQREPRTVEQVDLERYLGRWYEIARYPNRFQEGCQATTATYTLRDDGDITVVNACREGGVDGPERTAEGKAWVVDERTRAKLKVRFFWPFSGDYWIIDLGPDYEYAVVGDPELEYLWILAREPQLDAAVLDGILARLEAQGYDRKRLLWTEH
jgi:apolipoprotein D and lipocalin family protein